MSNFYAKILLFGEYTIIRGGQALAMPLERFSCQWTEGAEPGKKNKSNWHLRKFVDYLRELQQRNWLTGVLDLEKLGADLKAGEFLQSNIPVGYGLGSSGALCAAVYDRYAIDKISPEATGRYGDLRQILGLMESHFHGASSGVDPLICYLNRPVVIKPGAVIDEVDVPDWPAEDNGRFFLLDTRQPRETGPLVERFLRQCENEAYAQRIDHELIPLTRKAISGFLRGNWPELFEQIHEISLFQWLHFREMIPDALRAPWEKGVDSDYFKLKLCGAGGGGFLLGMTKDVERVEQKLAGKYPLLFL